jgi:1-acyl-sn-glycerol-3-phosphate acyltransferase
MSRHQDNPSSELFKSGNSNARDSTAIESSTLVHRPRLVRRLFYWWSLFVAAMLLLILGPPVITTSWIVGRRTWVYPFGRFGARNWLRLSGMKVKVRGLENLDPDQTYVFIANHRSFLDTAAAFYFLRKRVGLLAKKELLKVPILGIGMGFVNIMAIDRSNRERAIQTVRAATERLASGVSFVVFAEGTRARPGQFLPFKKGAFFMAKEAEVPVVPVAFKNTDKLMGKGTGEAWPGTIEIVVFPPIPTRTDFSDEEVRKLIDTVHSQIAAELEARG